MSRACSRNVPIFFSCLNLLRSGCRSGAETLDGDYPGTISPLGWVRSFFCCLLHIRNAPIHGIPLPAFASRRSRLDISFPRCFSSATRCVRARVRREACRSASAHARSVTISFIPAAFLQPHSQRSCLPSSVAALLVLSI